MSMIIWPKPPIETIQAFEARGNGRGSFGALVLWAAWGVESLHYLDDLDYERHNKILDNPHHQPNVIDISHIRWATGTSISSLDLCAAALGREFCAWDKSRELDLRDFDILGTSKHSSKLRTMLPAPARSWIDNVLTDNRYLNVHDARNYLVHSRLIRSLYLNKPTEFKISSTGNALTARDLILLSKELATDQINAFFTVLDTL